MTTLAYSTPEETVQGVMVGSHWRITTTNFDGQVRQFELSPAQVQALMLVMLMNDEEPEVVQTAREYCENVLKAAFELMSG